MNQSSLALLLSLTSLHALGRQSSQAQAKSVGVSGLVSPPRTPAKCVLPGCDMFISSCPRMYCILIGEKTSKSSIFSESGGPRPAFPPIALAANAISVVHCCSGAGPSGFCGQRTSVCGRSTNTSGRRSDGECGINKSIDRLPGKISAK